jgi:hypothetical protein
MTRLFVHASRLAAGDPRGEVKLTWHAKEVVRQIYDHTDPQLAGVWVGEIIRDFTDAEMPLEVRRLGRTIRRWRDQIVAWHRSHVSNGPTEADQQPREEGEAGGVRDTALPALPATGPALRRTPQLGPAREPHPTMKSEEPH